MINEFLDKSATFADIDQILSFHFSTCISMTKVWYKSLHQQWILSKCGGTVMETAICSMIYAKRCCYIYIPTINQPTGENHNNKSQHFLLKPYTAVSHG